MKHSIGTVVNFCTNESRFIGACLKQALVFSSQIIVPVASHFFNGMPENHRLLQQIYTAFPECLFIEYPFLPDRIPSSVFKTVRPEAFWHCISRLIGFSFLDKTIESILFLDADEIADGIRVSEWLNHSDYNHSAALKLANYWYFREPMYQAEKLEDSIVLAQRKALTVDMLLHDDERDAIYGSLPDPKQRNVVGLDNMPLFHHFSWVRTEQEMLQKVRSWGHRKDRDWEALVRREFAGPFQGSDFINGYRFRVVQTPFEFSTVFTAKGRANVLRLSGRDLIELACVTRKSFWSSLTRFFRDEFTF